MTLTRLLLALSLLANVGLAAYIETLHDDAETDKHTIRKLHERNVRLSHGVWRISDLAGEDL